jgi:enoyl-[acyl-carrier protein] reductase I
MGLLSQKRAVVAGVANRMSIAWGIAQALREQGADIAFLCLESNLRRVKKLAKELGSEIVIPCNVQKDDDIKNAFLHISDAFDGRLDILVHSIAYARIEDLGGEFIKVTRDGWNLAMDISAYSLVAFASYARPLMIASGGGSIIALTFAGGEKVVPGYNIMGVAKAALNMSVKYLSYDLGPDGIRINSIGPGPIRTLSSMMVEDFPNALELVKKHSPLLRNVDIRDINGSAVFLASDLSSGITGSIIKVSGGMDNVLAPSIPHPAIKRISNRHKPAEKIK